MKRISGIIILTMIFQLGISQNLIPFRIGDQWGYANENGEIIIKPKFAAAGEFRAKITWVKKNGKYGYIDKKGRKKTRYIFDKVKNFGSSGTATVWENNEKYCINLKGKKTECRSGCAGVIGIAKVFQTYRNGDKIGIIKNEIVKDKEGNRIEKIDSLPPIWEELKENQKGYAAVKKGSLWGIINKEGDVVVDCKYELVEVQPIAYKTNKFFKIKEKGKYGFLNEEGKLVVEPKYQRVEFYTPNNIAKAWLDDEFWGYIDEAGKEFFRPN